MLTQRILSCIIFLLSGCLVCLSCPTECQCGQSEVRCVIPHSTGRIFPNFTSLHNSSHLFTRLTLSHSQLQRVSLSTAFDHLRHLTYLDLSGNKFTDVSMIDFGKASAVANLVFLDISNNEIRQFNICQNMDMLRLPKTLKLSHNKIKQFITSCSPDRDKPFRWRKLDLSNNRLKKFDLNSFLDHASDLVSLNLSVNYLRRFSPLRSANYQNIAQPNLKRLDISDNRFEVFRIPKSISSLEKVRIDNNNLLQLIDPSTIKNIKQLSARYCRKLRYLDAEGTMQGLNVLDLRGCTNLNKLDLSLYYQLKEIYLSRSNVSSFLPPISWNTRQHGLLDLANTHNWNCSCNILWASTISRPETALCASPLSMLGQRIPDNLTHCHRPQILNFTSLTVYGLGEKAKLECRVGGDPHPVIIWTTPSSIPHVYRRLTSHRYFTNDETQGSLFHAAHPWHGSHIYRYELERDKEKYYYVLTDGSLYIDYITRTDAGLYTCTVISPLGNHSLTMELRLNYDILRAVRWHSQIVGMICAGCMLGIGFTIGIVKLIMRRCRSEEREKRHRTLKALLENLESYRADKFDKLRAYKSNKMDRLRYNYSGQVLRIKESCYTHMLNMQDHYNRRISKIRDNYETKIERLRESYAGQMMRIKDYRSHQVERIRDNYNQQILRIREYASVQLMRLREQYRLQQQFFIKLLETLNLENCMTVDVDELDDAMTRGAEVGLGETDDDDDDEPLDCPLGDNVIDTDAILAHIGTPNPGDLESRFPLRSLPSLPGLPDLECFVPEDFRQSHQLQSRRDQALIRSCGDDILDAEMSPLRSVSPVSEDYLTADSEYEMPAVHTVIVTPENCRVERDSLNAVASQSSRSDVSQVEASV